MAPFLPQCNVGWIHPLSWKCKIWIFILHHVSIDWQSGEGAHLWCTGINNRWGVQENTFLSKTHQKLSFYQKYIKKLSFYLKYIKSSKSIINRCQDLLGITKGGWGPLKAIEGLCAMMAPSEWGSGYEPLLRMGVGMGGGWIWTSFEVAIPAGFREDCTLWWFYQLHCIRPWLIFAQNISNPTKRSILNEWREDLLEADGGCRESRLSYKSISQILRSTCK